MKPTKKKPRKAREKPLSLYGMSLEEVVTKIASKPAKKAGKKK